MKFAIGSLEYFNSLGFNTEHWRKSVDGTLAMVHYDFAKVLCDDSQLEIYQHDSQEFEAILNSEAWTQQEEQA